MKKRILIIKLGSKGDVLRTTPMLRGLKERFPLSHITWLTYEDSVCLLEENRFIDRVFCFEPKDILRMQAEEFDLLINLDKDDEALALTSLINSKEKKGFGMDQQGNIIALNLASEYSVRLGLDDELKFRKNKKTYLELIFEVAELPYDLKYEYVLDLPQKSILFTNGFFKENEVSPEDILVGINTGAGRRFANKNLCPERIAELIDKFQKGLSVKVLLLGGPLEIGIHQDIKLLIHTRILESGCMHIKDFVALVNRCNLVICADTLTMHIAIALKKPIVAIFGSTCAQEIELYGRGEKIISPIECAPCYKNFCDKKPNCMDVISIEEISDKAKDLLSKYAKREIIL